MAEVQRFQLQEGEEVFDIYIESKTEPIIHQPVGDPDDPGGMGIAADVRLKMQEAQQMIRGYTLYVVNSFRDFKAAEIEEINLKFGLKFGAKMGLPYITEGSSESNLEISVKCKLSKPASPNNPQV